MGDITITTANPEDVSEIMEMMISAKNTIADTDWFVEDDEGYVKRHFGKCGITLKACGKKKILAFLIVDIPGEEPENLGFDLEFTKEQRDITILMESAVVRPEARGLGLQRKLMKEAEKSFRGTKYRYALATVHPQNIYSRNNFLALGYEEVMEKLKYGGLPRIIMKKRMNEIKL